MDGFHCPLCKKKYYLRDKHSCSLKRKPDDDISKTDLDELQKTEGHRSEKSQTAKGYQNFTIDAILGLSEQRQDPHAKRSSLLERDRNISQNSFPKGSKEKIDGIDKPLTPVSGTEAAPVAGSSGIQPKCHSNDTKKGFVCDVRSKGFGRKSKLLAHQRTDTGEKPFVCNLCKKSFNRKDHLTTHLRTHTNEKPFTCDICGMKFSQKAHLESHLRVHTGEKPFTCHECDKKFSRKYYLDLHILTHTGEKPHKCEVCGKVFSQKSHCNTHYKSKHGG